MSVNCKVCTFPLVCDCLCSTCAIARHTYSEQSQGKTPQSRENTDLEIYYYCPMCGGDTSNPCGCLDTFEEMSQDKSKSVGTQVVPLDRVIPSSDTHSSRQSVRRMCDTLRKQGQIEPLQVKVYSYDNESVPTFITYDADVHANDIIAAAKLLEWPTVIVVVVSKYIY